MVRKGINDGLMVVTRGSGGSSNKKAHNGIFFFLSKFCKVMLGVHSPEKLDWGLMFECSCGGSEEKVGENHEDLNPQVSLFKQS